ncbi:MAG TPA: hypothetical protein VIL20_01470 [Sandaracinaceae bacterium]
MRYRSGVRLWIVRALAVAGLALLGWLLHAVLAPRGLAWIVWTLGGLVAAFFVLELALRAHESRTRDRDEERWRRALDDPPARRSAIAELRRRIDRARRLGRRTRVEHARLATILAELLLADAQHEQAIATLAKVPVDELGPIEAAVVRHARAQAYLAAGDAEGAETVLRPIERTGHDVLDVSIALARAAARLARGDADGAEAIARGLEGQRDEELRGEARAIVAACLLAKGDAVAARALVETLDAELRRRLSLVGPAALREVLAA